MLMTNSRKMRCFLLDLIRTFAKDHIDEDLRELSSLPLRLADLVTDTANAQHFDALRVVVAVGPLRKHNLRNTGSKTQLAHLFPAIHRQITVDVILWWILTV